MQLNETQKTIIIPNYIQAYLGEKNIKAAELARMAKVSEGYMSQIVNGKTIHGNTVIKDKYYQSICKIIGYTMSPVAWQHFDTGNYKQIMAKIAEARAYKKRLTIDGDTGAGKTHGCRRYKIENPTETFVVTCSAMENGKEFAMNIAEVVGVETHGTGATIIKRVVRKLLVSCDDPVLIIDEAEHIGKRQGYINVIKALADALDEKVSIILVGMGINNILKKAYERNKPVFRQTARRFGEREICFDDISTDISNICITLGITNKSVHNWLINRVKNFGDLRYLINKAFDEALKSNCEIDTQLLNSIYI